MFPKIGECKGISFFYLSKKIISYSNGLGDVIFEKRPQSRSISVSVSARGVVKVTLPNYVSYLEAQQFLRTVENKIMATKREMAAKYPAAMLPTKAQLQALSKKAHEILPARTKALYELLTGKVVVRNKLGIIIKDPFRYNRVAIKDNKTNWGSCSTIRNLNLNMHLVELPVDLMDFVIVHELCHLVYSNHGARFHALVNAATDGREKELSARLQKVKLI